MIETAYRLHVAPGELFRQQGEHAAVIAGPARAFVIGGLVQCDIQMLAVAVRLAENGKFEGVGFDAGLAIADSHAGDADVTLGDQFAAPLACAETLRLQGAV